MRNRATFPPYGLLPLKDATQNVRLVISQQAIDNGQPFRGDVCAVGLTIKEHAVSFPGVFCGAWVFKTYTLVAATIGNKLQTLRYQHAAGLRTGINNFDNVTRRAQAFKAGDEIVLLAPIGIRRLGKGHGGGKHVGERRPYRVTGHNACHKRGVFINPDHEIAAIRIIENTGDLIAGFARQTAAASAALRQT